VLRQSQHRSLPADTSVSGAILQAATAKKSGRDDGGRLSGSAEADYGP
jgi:hypothetical protein